MSVGYAEDAEGADPLIGCALKDGWAIVSRIERTAKQTGGNFSYGYIAQRGDEQAFVKAFNFEAVFRNEEPMKALEIAVKSFNFEVDVLKVCSDSKMKRIVRAVGHGVVDNAKVPFGKLYYLLFELAEADARIHVISNQQADISWSLRCLHQIAAALQQLHSRGIFHQDLKPSNILVFNGNKNSKLADLGRAHSTVFEAPHDNAAVPGAWRYAAPELLYREGLADKTKQRAASELYLFGSMIFFFVMHLPLTPELMNHLRPEHRVVMFGGSNYGIMFRDVLPFINDAHDEVLRDFKAHLAFILDGNQSIADQITDLLRYATTPDPEQRGHPSSRRMANGNAYELEKFVSAFNVLASILEKRLVTNNARSA